MLISDLAEAFTVASTRRSKSTTISSRLGRLSSVRHLLVWGTWYAARLIKEICGATLIWVLAIIEIMMICLYILMAVCGHIVCRTLLLICLVIMASAMDHYLIMSIEYIGHPIVKKIY